MAYTEHPNLYNPHDTTSPPITPLNPTSGPVELLEMQRKPPHNRLRKRLK